VAPVAIDGALNAGILAAQRIATGDPAVMEKLMAYKESLTEKIVKANEELGAVRFKHRTN
jgi:5-(carboxyamino)imidazole ribonucleotide mutase